MKKFLVVLAAIALISCKKEKCYECEKNVGQADEAHWSVCGDDDHNRATQAGYSCREK